MFKYLTFEQTFEGIFFLIFMGKIILLDELKRSIHRMINKMKKYTFWDKKLTLNLVVSVVKEEIDIHQPLYCLSRHQQH